MSDDDLRRMSAAIASCDIETVREVLDGGFDVATLIRPSMRWTCLHEATYEGCGDIAELLIERGADIEIRNEEGMSALDLALYQGDYPHMVEILLRHGAVRNSGLKTRAEWLDDYYEAKENVQKMREDRDGWAR
ncbi:ankyrin repeat protein [Sinorhizobium fredii]|uniref:ankyrin repeat domain-containing protein n=1 Tax=Rhizobium fredii TaxID=380 RepID=UPI0035173209